ncbi:hypothetical protein DCAR_0208232 [Daucus carota subsp. sativus]|uniref:Uncharacterized protein n=1 Tax=Daucus carota subsp. sativus TaxID=79200 RepID=A0A161X674_DAUCS|nr:PREDICTED: uncharacterized protein LOC108209612 [Daucus carota subsp. sativus]WOG88997.1 hypothetical protein DCAR_0208232 [Daucus carota subsp. sativus]
MSIFTNLITTTTILILLNFSIQPSYSREAHVINFRSPNLYPESFTWDPSSQHFIVGSLRRPTLQSVSDAGVVDTLLSDASLPSDSAFLGLAVDTQHRRIVAVVHSSSSPAVASYNLRNGSRIFLTLLPDSNATASSAGANDVAVDFSGNAYVTNSASNLIYKVNKDGEFSVLSRSPIFSQSAVEPNTPYSSCGLNGVVYVSKGYLLVVQSNTGKMFKVNVDDGSARTVLLNKALTAADGMAVRRDGVVVVASREKAYFIKSDSSWSEGVVFDETALDAERFASAVTIGGDRRVYVLYGHIGEGMMGNTEREEFAIVEIESEKESKEDSVWIFVLIGLGLAYFMFWRFQMRQLVTDMNKKAA